MTTEKKSIENSQTIEESRVRHNAKPYLQKYALLQRFGYEESKCWKKSVEMTASMVPPLKAYQRQREWIS